MAGRLAFFLLLNLVDLFLSWRLMHGEGTSVYESNPLARKCLVAGGWWALIVYKLVIVGVVSLAIMTVARARPRVGRRLANGVCLIVGGVVLYSFAIPQAHGVLPNGLTPEQEMEIERRERLTAESVRLQDLVSLRNQLVDEVVVHRRTLADAVELLAAADQLTPGRRLEHLRWLYVGYSDRECLAAAFVNYAVAKVRDNPPLEQCVRHELETAYKLRFGAPVPEPIDLGASPEKSVVVQLLERFARACSRCLADRVKVVSCMDS